MFQYLIKSSATTTKMEEVGLYIKDSIEYRVRHGLNEIDESIEHFWIDCKGNNCNKN